MDLLQTEKLFKHFGGVTAVNGVSLNVAAGERRALIGPNGAGKTTLFNLLSGEIAPSDGRIVFDGMDVTALPPYKRSRLGIARTFQRNNLFLGLTVWENARLAGHPVKNAGWRSFGSVGARQLEVVRRSLAQAGLLERREELARSLSYGEQRQLELAIALATQPRILLLDEPAAGMSPAETERLMRFLCEMPREITILIVEHDMDLVFALAERITVLQYGEVIADGAPSDVKNNSAVMEAYLGV
jgi:branched-chain amino acid transport system ATP-binding protein